MGEAPRHALLMLKKFNGKVIPYSYLHPYGEDDSRAHGYVRVIINQIRQLNYDVRNIPGVGYKLVLPESSKW